MKSLSAKPRRARLGSKLTILPLEKTIIKSRSSHTVVKKFKKKMFIGKNIFYLPSTKLKLLLSFPFSKKRFIASTLSIVF